MKCNEIRADGARLHSQRAYNTIISKDNPLIKKIIKLAGNKRFRESESLAVLYGAHLIEEAIKYKQLKQLFILDTAVNHYQELLVGVDDLAGYVINHDLMRKINLLDAPVDIVGVLSIERYELSADVFSDDCIILENIQDVGNLGTIIRSAVAANVKNIILSKGCVDIYNPKVLRASQGVQLGLRVFDNIQLTDFIPQYKGQVILTTPHTASTIYDLDLTQTSAWVFGNEGRGLSENLLNLVQTKAKIPLAPQVESLNVAMAAGICLFEMVRQRLN